MKNLQGVLQNLAKKQAQKCKNRWQDSSVIIVRLCLAIASAKPEHSAIISRASKQIKAKPSPKSTQNRKNLSNLTSAYFRALLDYKRDFYNCKNRATIGTLPLIFANAKT